MKKTLKCKTGQIYEMSKPLMMAGFVVYSNNQDEEIKYKMGNLLFTEMLLSF